MTSLSTLASLEEAKQQLQLLLDAIDEKAEKVGFIVNVTRIKSMAASDSPLTMKCKDKPIELVNELRYVRVWIDYRGEIANETRGGLDKLHRLLIS